MCARSKAGAVPGFGKYNRKKRSVDDNRKNKNGKNVDGAVRLETQPTVGVEIDSLDAGKKGVVLLREVGSPMMAMWSSYFEDCDAVIFIVSRGDRLRLAESAVEFWQLLQHEHIRGKPILLLCSHSDAIDCMTVAEVEKWMALKNLSSSAPGGVDVRAANLCEGSDCDDVLEWVAGVLLR
eukprot:g1001.t1